MHHSILPESVTLASQAPWILRLVGAGTLGHLLLAMACLRNCQVLGTILQVLSFWYEALEVCMVYLGRGQLVGHASSSAWSWWFTSGLLLTSLSRRSLTGLILLLVLRLEMIVG